MCVVRACVCVCVCARACSQVGDMLERLFDRMDSLAARHGVRQPREEEGRTGGDCREGARERLREGGGGREKHC